MELDTKKLRELVEKKYTTDFKFSRAIEMHHTSVSRILSGDNKHPRLCTLARIAIALNLTLDEMIKK